MIAWTRGGLAALGLLAAGAQMAWAAKDAALPERTVSAPATQGRTGPYGGMAFMQPPLNADRRAAVPGVMASPIRPLLQEGNDFNWQAGG